MERITDNSNKGYEKPVVHFQLEDELDDFDFKPLTKGLGFHQKKKSESFSAKSRPLPSERTAERRTHVTPRTAQALRAPMDEAPLPAALQKVQTPIAKRSAAKVAIPSANKPKAKRLSDAPLDMVLFAWFVDLMVITATVGILAVAFWGVSGLSWEQAVESMNRPTVALLFATIVAVFYIAYFTVLDTAKTPGKALLGLQLVTTSGGKPTMFRTFVRTIVCLFSVPALLLPLLIDFHGKLSDTKVVRE